MVFVKDKIENELYKLILNFFYSFFAIAPKNCDKRNKTYFLCVCDLKMHLFKIEVH